MVEADELLLRLNAVGEALDIMHVISVVLYITVFDYYQSFHLHQGA